MPISLCAIIKTHTETYKNIREEYPMIDIYLLEHLLAFHDYGTLSAASEKLHLSQPALSRSMRKLEDMLGVNLFERQKNKITLNENGIMAAQYAAKILEQEMVERIRALDRSRHTITLGSCAPVPLLQLTPLLSQAYPDMTIASEIKKEDTLLRGLSENIYQLIVLTHLAESDDLESVRWKNEYLYITLPPAHPLANRDGIHLHELNGQTILLYSQIGFWYDLCLEKMPDARFLVQDEYEALGELVLASALPAISTNLVRNEDERHLNRVFIPILDSEANVIYYCIFKKQSKALLSSFIRQL